MVALVSTKPTACSLDFHPYIGQMNKTKIIIKALYLPLDFILLTFHFLKVTLWQLGYLVKDMFDLPSETSSPFKNLFEGTPSGQKKCIPTCKYRNPILFTLFRSDLKFDVNENCYCRDKEVVSSEIWHTSWLRMLILCLGIVFIWTAIGTLLFIGARPYIPQYFKTEIKSFIPGSGSNKKDVQSSKNLEKRRAKAAEFQKNADQLFLQKKYKEAALEYGNAVQLDPENARTHFNRGNSLLHSKRTGAAIKAYKQAVHLDPAMWEAHLRLCKLLWKSGHFDQAVIHSKQLCTLKTDIGEGHIILGISHFKKNDLKAVEKALAQAEKGTIEDGELCVAAANLYFEINDQARSLQFFQKALQIDSNLVHAHLGKARLCHSQGQLALANACLNDVIAIDPKNIAALSGLAEINRSKGDVTTAIDQYRKIVRLETATGDHRTRLAELLIQSEKSDEGIEILESVIKENPDHTRAHLALADVFIRHKLFGMSAEHAQAVLAVREDDIQANTRLVRVYMAQEKYRESIRYIKSVLSKNEDNLHMNLLLAKAKLHTDNLPESIQIHHEMIAKHPQSTLPWISLGKTYIETDDLEKAKNSFRQALKRSPNEPVAMKNLAATLLELGENLDEAFPLAKELAIRLPNTPSILNIYGLALFHRHEFQEAKKVFLSSSKFNSKNPETHYLLGKTFIKLGENTNAQQSLRKSLQLSQNFKGAQEAQSLLQKLE